MSESERDDQVFPDGEVGDAVGIAWWDNQALDSTVPSEPFGG